MENRKAIAEIWLWRILRTYPAQSAEFMARERDPFRNPIGHRLRESLEILIDELLLGMDTGRIMAALDTVMQIRAVQDLAPGEALEFLFQLKDILRSHLSGAERELLDSRVDRMALAGFELYMKYRERTWQIRAREARRRVFVLERRFEPREKTAWQERGGS